MQENEESQPNTIIVDCSSSQENDEDTYKLILNPKAAKLHKKVENLNNQIQANNEKFVKLTKENNDKAAKQIEKTRKESLHENEILAKFAKAKIEKLMVELTMSLEKIKEISNSAKNTLYDMREESKNQTLVNKRNQEKFEEAREVINLNVGGKVFTTSKITLSKFPNTYLSNLINLKPNDGESYFVDRDNNHFGRILNYMRDGGKVEHFLGLDKDAMDILKIELDFFGIKLPQPELDHSPIQITSTPKNLFSLNKIGPTSTTKRAIDTFSSPAPSPKENIESIPTISDTNSLRWNVLKSPSSAVFYNDDKSFRFSSSGGCVIGNKPVEQFTVLVDSSAYLQIGFLEDEESFSEILVGDDLKSVSRYALDNQTGTLSGVKKGRMSDLSTWRSQFVSGDRVSVIKIGRSITFEVNDIELGFGWNNAPEGPLFPFIRNSLNKALIFPGCTLVENTPKVVSSSLSWDVSKSDSSTLFYNDNLTVSFSKLGACAIGTKAVENFTVKIEAHQYLQIGFILDEKMFGKILEGRNGNLPRCVLDNDRGKLLVPESGEVWQNVVKEGYKFKAGDYVSVIKEGKNIRFEVNKKDLGILWTCATNEGLLYPYIRSTRNDRNPKVTIIHKY